jgi:hypothetical protein
VLPKVAAANAEALAAAAAKEANPEEIDLDADEEEEESAAAEPVGGVCLSTESLVAHDKAAVKDVVERSVPAAVFGAAVGQSASLCRASL